MRIFVCHEFSSEKFSEFLNKPFLNQYLTVGKVLKVKICHVKPKQNLF